MSYATDNPEPVCWPEVCNPQLVGRKLAEAGKGLATEQAAPLYD